MTETASCEAVTPRTEIGLLFVVLVCISVALTSYLPTALHELWRQLVMRVAEVLGVALGVPVSGNADILRVNGFDMKIADECTAINYVIILSTAILLYVRHTLVYRLTGILVAVPVIVAANATRLVITGMCGVVSRELFHFVHEYLWVVLFALLVFALCKVWADHTLHISRETARRTAVITVCSSAIFFLLREYIAGYGALLALLASVPLKAFTGDSLITISWAGTALRCVHGGTAYHVPIAVEYLNVAVFAGLVLPLQRRGDWWFLSVCLCAITSALLLNAMFIANIIWLKIRLGNVPLDSFVLMEKGVLFAVPFTLLWIALSARQQAPR